MAELICTADLTWIGGALRMGAPEGAIFVPVLRAYLRLAGEILRNLLDDGAVRLLAAGDATCA
jgi:hypothetical protein